MYRDANGRFTSTKNDADVKAAKSRDTKQNAEVNDGTWGYYSLLLNKPFERLADMRAAEEAYKAELAAKEAAKDAKKADAQAVQEAYKALNAARKEYKEKLTQLTAEYAKSLESLQKAFELGKKDIQGKLAEAEKVYQAALKAFTDKYESYHITLKDGDFETTISNEVSSDVFKTSVDLRKLSDLFGLMFNF